MFMQTTATAVTVKIRNGLLTALILSMLHASAVANNTQAVQNSDSGAAAAETNDPADPNQTDRPADDAPDKNTELIRLTKDGEVSINPKTKQVIVGGAVAFRKGVLEMFACVKNTKEHESVIAVNAKAYHVHTALLAVGAKPGKPVQYDPTYKPASGPKIKVEVVWKDKDGKEQRRRAQDMIRNVRTQKPMKHDWVFAGSYFWTDEETKKKYYQAEGGELICVSNFSTATMDLPIESSQSTGQLLFEAETKNIPPLGTKVQLVLTPEIPKKPKQVKLKPTKPKRQQSKQATTPTKLRS